jgi:hypothetical protein
MSAELLGWVAWGLVFLSGVLASFFWGFSVGRQRGRAEGSRCVWSLLGGGRKL